MNQTKADIKKWMKSKGVSREELAQKCFVTYLTVKGWFSKNGKIPPAKALIIESLMREDEQKVIAEMSKKDDWKAYSVMVSQEEYNMIAAAAALDGMSVEEWSAQQLILDSSRALSGKEKRNHGMDGLFEGNGETKMAEERFIEIAGNIAAGGLMEGDSIQEQMRVRKSYPKGAYALRVSGRSMEPAIHDGSVIVVNPWKSTDLPKLGELVVYYDGRGVTLKRLAKHGDEFVMESLNPDYPDIHPIDGGAISAVFVEVLDA